MVRVGTAGWSISRETASAFQGEGPHLARYARVLSCAEINSSFSRSHRSLTYRRWADLTPPGFRFSVKLPRIITHDRRLRRVREPLLRFLDEASGLGDRLAVLLVQLPPSFAFEAQPVRRFFALLRQHFADPVVCEPRHLSWFTPVAERALLAHRIGRVAADPPPVPAARGPGGWLGMDGEGSGAVVYYRWHGAPRMYWSRYEASWLRTQAIQLGRWPRTADCWCIFDNTASGAAISNGIELQAILGESTQRLWTHVEDRT